jgi:hypothetical protein
MATLENIRAQVKRVAAMMHVRGGSSLMLEVLRGWTLLTWSFARFSDEDPPEMTRLFRSSPLSPFRRVAAVPCKDCTRGTSNRERASS